MLSQKALETACALMLETLEAIQARQEASTPPSDPRCGGCVGVMMSQDRRVLKASKALCGDAKTSASLYEVLACLEMGKPMPWEAK